MTPLTRRLTAKLQAARRLLTGDRQLEDEPPDGPERITRLPAAADNVCHSSAAHRDLEKKELTRAVCDTKPQAAAALMSTMTAEHDSLQAEEYDAAARPLRTAQHAAEGGEQKKKKRQNDQPGAAAAHQGGQPGLQNDQPGAAAAHQGGQYRDEKGTFAQQQRSQQPEQGTTAVSPAVLAVQEQQDSCSTARTEKGTFAQQQRTCDEDDGDDWAWPDSDDGDDERCIATLKVLHRMDFSAMDEDRRQHDSCSTAQAQAQAQAQEMTQAQAQEKTQAPAQAQAQQQEPEQGTAVAR